MDIVVENLTKRYGMQRAVDNISFKVKTGEVLGFLGPNGAGKTTTMKAITCFMSPSEGDVQLGGHSVLKEPDLVKKHIGYLPEHNSLYEDMPIIDYLKFVAELQAVPKNEIKARILEMVQICGLGKEKHKKIRELSKGYKQRVGLAQALIHHPDVLILDEPTSGLDPNQIVEIRELIKRIGREKTVILSSHILAEVEATCDRILIINHGKIVADGTSEDLRKRAQGKEILKIEIQGGEPNDVFQSLQKIESIEVVDFIKGKNKMFEVQSKENLSSKKAVFSMCVDKGWFLTELSPVETKLEDVFRELTLN